ncbi:hypothetical protein [Vibrio splendidus]|jgi:hypothetical protein|uniref:hypothetical protein n=1 Tax=Vibrio splendidus TaxID=29497 RepID=UPI000C8474A9|nr:hypothetical protein [Vibrio splendidus]PMP51665.1 hypothetical protein BCS83_02380 [Vibrio splendidus]
MTTYKKVRKNAKKQINRLLTDAVGIIARSSSMQIDDSYDNNYKRVEPDQVMDWLAIDANYSDAVCYMMDDEFHVGGPYSFCDKFTAYFDKDEFENDARRFGLLENESTEPEETAELIFVDFTRRVRLTA